MLETIPSDAGERLPDPFPGEYRILKPLGEGAFGKVWLAEDLNLGRPVALKTLQIPGQSDAAAPPLAALRKEARLLAAVRHPPCHPRHGAGQAGGAAGGPGEVHTVVIELEHAASP